MRRSIEAMVETLALAYFDHIATLYSELRASAGVKFKNSLGLPAEGPKTDPPGSYPFIQGHNAIVLVEGHDIDRKPHPECMDPRTRGQQHPLFGSNTAAKHKAEGALENSFGHFHGTESLS